MTGHERRLTTIVAIDVAGYSRLMHADETGTLARLKEARAVTDPIGAEHGGRIVGTWGDGLLVEFPSVVEAVEFARKAQAAMAEFNDGTPEDRQLLYRIGINLGDVIVEEGDLFGDGVNVAARLEALAKPGGVVLSRAARDQVRDKLDVEFADLGEVEVKNIARPVRAFRMLREGEVVAPAPGSRLRRLPVLATAAALLMLAAGSGAWIWWGGEIATAPEDDPILVLPTGPKIVVLPFDNLSGDPEQDYFVDGLVEDLTTRLTDHGYLFVIARNSAFKYKGQSPDVRDVGKDLGVDYVVEGSVRHSGDRIRVNAQLLNAKDGTHVWAETYDRTLDVEGVFGIQDELTIGISEAIGGTKGAITRTVLNDLEAKRPADIAAFECVMLHRSYWNTYDPLVHARARDCLEEAVAKDSNYAPAWQALSSLYRAEHENNVNRRSKPLDRAEAAVDRALQIDPGFSMAHLTRASLMRTRGRTADALSSLKEALRLSPNQPEVLHVAAYLYTN